MVLKGYIILLLLSYTYWTNIYAENVNFRYEECMEYEQKTCYGFGIPYAVGGTPVKPKELPFMGLVGYGTKNNVDWACGCSLISEKFVLSAAHCTKDPNDGLARWVRLGELDLSRNNETANPVDFEIIRRINHPNYRSEFVYNDIALYELNSLVTFTDTIKPICLPQPNSYYNVRNVFGAGWGRTDYAGPRSSILLKVDLDYLAVRDCTNTSELRVAPRGLEEETMICAGVLEGGRDTCSGDSGGPLFLPKTSIQPPCILHTQLGVTSFGKQCALKGFPAIYTRILNYLPWIESIVWPDY